MRKTLLTLITLITLGTNAQNIYKQDSIYFEECKLIVKNLFDGNLIKDCEIQTNHLPTDYFWEIDEKDYKFDETYKHYLNDNIWNCMRIGDLTMTIAEYEDCSTSVLLNYDIEGECDDLYFDFMITDKIQLISIIKYEPFWSLDTLE